MNSLQKISKYGLKALIALMIVSSLTLAVAAQRASNLVSKAKCTVSPVFAASRSI